MHLGMAVAKAWDNRDVTAELLRSLEVQGLAPLCGLLLTLKKEGGDLPSKLGA